jgi:CheY-like chemotaxis protein
MTDGTSTTSSRAGHRDVLAIINTSPDAVELLRHVLEQAGFLVASTFTWLVQSGQVDLDAFLRTHQPKVIIYDLAPPYERNWDALQNLRSTVLKDYQFVLTSVNCAQVEALVGKDERIYEVVGKPHDLDAIVRAVKEAVRSRPTR